VRIAVIGGGINGAGIAWELARKDYQVTLFDKGRCGAQTSSKTTKMIHGGIRYLENMHFRLVRESLRDRAWLIEHLPQLVQPIEIIIPVYADSPRSRLTIRAGLILYDRLAGRHNIAPHQRWSADELLARLPLRRDDLRGGFSFWDGQVDDFALVRTVVASAAREGATIREETPVLGLQHRPDRWVVRTDSDESSYDFLINAAGPWMNELLGGNGIRSRYQLSLVRGSHLVLRHRVNDAGLLLQSVSDRRVFCNAIQAV
jgi:glycerol-3-phosphate dehydrogenase